MTYEDIKEEMHEMWYYDLIEHPKFNASDIHIALEYCGATYLTFDGSLNTRHLKTGEVMVSSDYCFRTNRASALTSLDIFNTYHFIKYFDDHINLGLVR